MRGRRVVDVVRRHHFDTRCERQLGERVVAVPVERITVVPELDEHPVAPEGLDERVEGARAARGPSRASAAGTVPLRHPVSTNQWAPFPSPASCSRVRRGAPFSPRICASLIAGEARVAGRAIGQHHEVLTGRIGAAGMEAGGAETQGELGAEDGGETERPGRLGEAHDPVEPVVVGDRERGQPQARGLLDQLLGMARSVEKGEVRVAVQLGVIRAGSLECRHMAVPGSASGEPSPNRPGT